MSNEERTAPEEKYNRYSLVVAVAKRSLYSIGSRM